MSKKLKCVLCGQTWPVSEVDPDATVDDAVGHSMIMHDFDPRLGVPGSIEIIESAGHEEGEK